MILSFAVTFTISLSLCGWSITSKKWLVIVHMDMESGHFHGHNSVETYWTGMNRGRPRRIGYRVRIVAGHVLLDTGSYYAIKRCNVIYTAGCGREISCVLSVKWIFVRFTQYHLFGETLRGFISYWKRNCMVSFDYAEFIIINNPCTVNPGISKCTPIKIWSGVPRHQPSLPEGGSVKKGHH